MDYLVKLLTSWGSSASPTSEGDSALNVNPSSDVDGALDSGVSQVDAERRTQDDILLETLQKMLTDKSLENAMMELNKDYSRLTLKGKNSFHEIFWKALEKGIFCRQLDQSPNIKFLYQNTNRVQLGSGTYGRVYKATMYDHFVAVKILRESDRISEVIASPKNHRNFFREIKNWCSIPSSPHVMGLVGYYIDKESRGMGFVSLMAEDNLRNWSANCKERKYDLHRLKHILGAAKGIHHLHQANVVHGDVRASNVLLEADVAKIADFGISKLDGSITSFSIAGGIDQLAKPWLAPELIEYEYASRTTSSDIFAFARLIVEVYTGGAHPFAGEMIADLKKHIREFRHPIRPEGIDNEVWKIMEQYWVKEPKDRGTAEDIIRCIGDMNLKEALTDEFHDQEGPDDGIFPIGS